MISFYIYENKCAIIRKTKQLILWQFLLLLFVLFLSNSILAQRQFEIREKIIPLRSTRSDVEKIASFVKDSGNFIRYETDNEFINVIYSRERCLKHGWNIPENTVLEFSSYPKSDLMLEDILKINQNLFETNDDIGTRYLINSQIGIVFVVRPGTDKVEYLNFNPVPSDAELRCKEFPEFNLISSHYAPFEKFIIKNKKMWHVSMIYDTLHQIIENPEQKGYIFVYCMKGEKAKCEKLKKEIEEYIVGIKKINPNQVEVILGGTRNSMQIETFLRFKDDPPPVARPTLPF